MVDSVYSTGDYKSSKISIEARIKNEKMLKLSLIILKLKRCVKIKLKN